MRTLRHVSLVFAVLALTAAGCSSENKGKIEGTKWSSVATTVPQGPLPAGALRLEFSEDGKVTYVAGAETFTGKYSLGWGENVTLNLDQEIQGRKKHTEKITIKGDELTMTDSDGTALKFSRVQ